MNVEDPPAATRPPTSVRQKRKKRRPDSKLQLLDPLLKGRAIPIAMIVAAVVYVGLRAAEYRGSSYYADVLPAQSEADVLYQRGKPASVRPSAETGGLEWIYNAPAVRVRFGADGRVVSTSCSGSDPNSFTACPTALGIAVGDNEMLLGSKLGTPPRSSLVNGVKVAEYPGPGLKFYLQRFRVQSIEVRRRADMPTYLGQFAVYAIPS